MARESGVDAVLWGATYGSRAAERDADLQRTLEEQGLRAIVVHDAPAVAPEETGGSRHGEDGYRSFAPYLAAWLSSPRSMRATRLALHATPPHGEALPVPQEFGSQDQPREDASEAAALATLQGFLRAPALAYATTRSVPSIATSGLSAHLSFGTIAARTVHAFTEERASDPFLLEEERISLRAFARALAMRDFFLQLAWFHPATVDEPLQERMRPFRFSRSHPSLDAWRSGTTGYPLVDAGMRQLHATGTMHQRARAVAASFLCFDLGVHWRVGRDEWDRLLVEDDPALATGNWQWIAGVGADLAQYPRIYNPRKQLRRFDPEATYVRRWIPELTHRSAAEIVDPERLEDRAQLSLGIFNATPYPSPVVEHEAVARAFLERYTAFVRAAPRTRDA